MPTYVYRREDGSTFETWQKITDDPLETCPETGQEVERLISGGSFHLKGSGFYETDYARSNNNGSSASETSNGEAADSSDDAAADTTAADSTD